MSRKASSIWHTRKQLYFVFDWNQAQQMHIIHQMMNDAYADINKVNKNAKIVFKELCFTKIHIIFY